MNNRIVFILFVGILIISCATENKKPQLTSSSEEGELIIIKEEQIVHDLLPIEAKIQYVIPLETTFESMVNEYKSLAFSTDKVIILNGKSDMKFSDANVLLFDTLGNFIRLIGSNGKAPHEYTVPMSMHIGTNDVIQVYCNVKQSVLSYNLKGEFISAIKLPTRSPHVAMLDDENIVFEYPNQKLSDYQIGVYNLLNDTTFDYLPFSEDFKESFNAVELSAPVFTKFKGQIFFCPKKSKNIYTIVNNQPVIKYKLDIAGLDFHYTKPPKSLSGDGIMKWQRANLEKSKGSDQLEQITFKQSDSYDDIVFRFNYNFKFYHILREKKTGKIMVGKTTSETRKNLKEVSNQLLWATKATRNGKFVAVLNTEKIQNLSRVYGELPIEKRDRLCNYKELKAIADKRTPFSNSVLVVFSLSEANSN